MLMSPPRRVLAAAGLAALLVLTGCGAPPAGPASDGGRSARNCGIDVAVPAPPQRIYTVYQPAIEMAHALGVSDRLVGTAYLDAAVLPEYARAQAATEYLPALPSREALLAANPDFVLAGFNDVFADGGAESFGSRASLHALGVRTWVFGPLCPSADGRSDEAIDPASVTMESVYADLHDLGALFGAEDRAVAVVAEMQAEVAAVRQRVAGDPRPRVAVLRPTEDGMFRVAGGPDFVTRILDIAGADNAFADLLGRRNFTVGAEEIIARDPDVILVDACCDASYTTADAEPDAERIRAHPALAGVRAVVDGRVEPFLFADRAAGVRAPHAAERVATLVHPGRT